MVSEVSVQVSYPVNAPYSLIFAGMMMMRSWDMVFVTMGGLGGCPIDSSGCCITVLPYLAPPLVCGEYINYDAVATVDILVSEHIHHPPAIPDHQNPNNLSGTTSDPGQQVQVLLVKTL